MEGKHRHYDGSTVNSQKNPVHRRPTENRPTQSEEQEPLYAEHHWKSNDGTAQMHNEIFKSKKPNGEGSLVRSIEYAQGNPGKYFDAQPYKGNGSIHLRGGLILDSEYKGVVDARINADTFEVFILCPQYPVYMNHSEGTYTVMMLDENLDLQTYLIDDIRRVPHLPFPVTIGTSKFQTIYHLGNTLYEVCVPLQPKSRAVRELQQTLYDPNYLMGPQEKIIQKLGIDFTQI